MQVPSELSALEAVAATPLGGRARSAPALAKAGQDPIAAIAAAIEGALDSGPPAIAFSGGRDSSLLLAVAARVCRRAGIEPPLPITLCMPGALAEADERGWQERVLKHLKLPDWHRIPITGELDLIGHYARRHLVRDGLLFPANAHSIVPMLETAGRRCLIVGAGGDELLSPQQWWSVHELLGRRRSPQQRDFVRLAAAAIPRPLRGLARRSWAAELDALKWLRPAAKARLNVSLRIGFEEPVRWRTAVRDAAARREVVLPLRSMERLASASDQRVLAPLLDPIFVGALARTGGHGGWGTRTATMNALAGDLLPPDLIRRSDKARFNRVFFADESRAFAASWSGGGLDDRLVDPEALRREWLSEVPDFRTALLLQGAWLADQQAELRPAA